MKTRRITRPTLAELWRQILATLEGLEVEDAPDLARSLAVSGLLGRPSRAVGVLVERSGDDFTITSPEPFRACIDAEGPACRHRRAGTRARQRVPACC